MRHGDLDITVEPRTRRGGVVGGKQAERIDQVSASATARSSRPNHDVAVAYLKGGLGMSPLATLSILNDFARLENWHRTDNDVGYGRALVQRSVRSVREDRTRRPRPALHHRMIKVN